MADCEVAWEDSAADSVLLKAVSHWRQDSEAWFQGAYDRLPETVRVNPLRRDWEWVEDWLSEASAKRMPWFSGPGSAWQLPFERGKGEGEENILLKALHETGRVTRQEAVSMLPVIALDPRPGDVVLDMCASPGSKTTQICEHLGNSGVVIANEVMSGRVNTLVSNVQRHASRAAVVVQHDGRHMPMVPEDGFDKVLVDVPCTGSGTTRKNPDVWAKWLPSSGRSLHNLQSDLLTRAIRMTKRGGRIVYATCSLDPVENEAVVARALEVGEARIVPGHSLLDGVPSEHGLTHWPVLDDKGESTEELEIPESMMPPLDGFVRSELGHCVRIWNDAIEGGGFFLAVLERIGGDDRHSTRPTRVLTPDEVEPDPGSFPQPLDDDWERRLEITWGAVPTGMWIRGKSLLWSTEEVLGVWESGRSRRGGRIRVPGRRWRPLKAIHIGLIAARIRQGELSRIVSRAATSLLPEIQSGFTEVSDEGFDSVLLGKEPAPADLDEALGGMRGGRILVDEGGGCMTAWIGGRVTPMVSEAELRVLRAMRGLPIVLGEEE
jgi:16S rRNA C967 or C1407 C5-methylase (RsmB/RsmF family)